MTFGFLVDIVAYGPEGVTSQIRLEGPFELHDPTGARQSLDPEKDTWERLAALFVLRNDTIQLARFTETSELRVEFGSGYVITSAGEGPYENWELQAPGGVLIVGMEGEPAIWDGEPENKRFYRWDGTRAVEISRPTEPPARGSTL